MILNEENILEWAELYIHNKLEKEQLAHIQTQLASDNYLLNQWNESIEILSLLRDKGEHQSIKKKIKAAQEQHTAQPINKNIPFKKPVKFWKLGVAAAILILVSSGITAFIMENKGEKVGAEYMMLRREVETIKNSQSKLFDSIKINKASESEEKSTYYSGTGFAISIDGFIATNYHVVKDADLIFVENSKGENLKAYLVAYEANSDLAILKIEDQEYSIGAASLPYSFAPKNSDLGQKVFSIGFPQENLVYHEGYISCEQGFDGNISSYQLEMISNPGQSGAPVLDKDGNVIALITGKQSNTLGKTYAVHAQSLLELIESLPQETKLQIKSNNKLKGLERTQQVQKVRDYIFAVSVR